MKKFLNIFFVILGVVFFIKLLVMGVMWYLFPVPESEAVDKNPLLSDTQEKALERLGIDPASIPSEISPEQEQCFEDALGSERVAEIKAGDAPTATDLFKSKECL